ncbi:MAG: ABC transporter ATP-binding protein [Muribaculaceae bacterium]|nr:ABC transporter ATP-binding protein [Muribaculaceae bacterium]
MKPAIEISAISKSHGAVVALDRVSFTVGHGELFGLIGPDGAGKSSLYRILSTLSIPDSGVATVNGLDVVRDYKKLRSRIGYMPEKFSLYQDMTVAENMAFFSSLFGVSVKENYDLIAPVFSQLEKFPHRMAGALSGGMKQKLALSCALIHRPDILLLDEPTTGVDAVSRNEFWDMLATLREKGITILVSTSYMDEATRCERIAMINNGHILAVDTPSALIGRMDENLYNAVATDMFGLLTGLRRNPDVIDCYTFGATLHVVGNEKFSALKAEAMLRDAGIPDARIYPATGNIEDLFIKQIRDER